MNHVRNRKSWRSYPAELISIVTQFQLDGGLQFGPLRREDAVALRSNLYHFRDALWRDYAGDLMAQELHDIVNTIMSRIRPPKGSADDLVTLELFLNPLVALSRAQAPQKLTERDESSRAQSPAPTAPAAPSEPQNDRQAR